MDKFWCEVRSSNDYGNYGPWSDLSMFAYESMEEAIQCIEEASKEWEKAFCDDERTFEYRVQICRENGDVEFNKL